MRRSRSPFDAAARGYDDAFSRRLAGGWLREFVQRHLAEAFPRDSRVLELGCGTGEDAVFLASRGVRVLATDASAEMLEVAREKAVAEGVGAAVRFTLLDLNRLGDVASEPDPLPSGEPFDGVFSSFGAINCVADRNALAAFLAGSLRPGGHAILVVMGPFCLLETLGHLLRGRAATAFRRFRSGGTRARIAGGGSVRVWYPSAHRLRLELGPDFACRRAVPVGPLLPPSDFFAFVERWPRTFARLASLDRRIAPRLPAAWPSDHYLLWLERRAGDPAGRVAP